MRVIFFAALFAVYAWASDIQTTPKRHVIEGVRPCWSKEDVRKTWVTVWKAPSESYGRSVGNKPVMAERMVHLLSNYSKHGIETSYSISTEPYIKSGETPVLKWGNILGRAMTMSNYTIVIDSFIFTKMEGEYWFYFNADDAAIVQLGSPSTHCYGPFDTFINPRTLFDKFRTGRYSGGTKVFLEKDSVYPMRIIVTNLFYKNGLILKIYYPNGKPYSWY